MPDYFPPAIGRYEVKPGLFRFGKPLGGGEADGHVFQIDSSFPRYRQTKLESRAERLGKYFRVRDLAPETERAVVTFIVDRLIHEHPDLFALDGRVLRCALTGDRVLLDDATAFDTLASQVQEVPAIVSVKDDQHWISALHICFPNFWAPEEKIGASFAAIHEPVAGMEQMNRQSGDLVNVMLNATDGLVRFAWGITSDDELNHHPDKPSSSFDPANPSAFVRVERQTVWGFPNLGAALFTIRTYFHDCALIRRDTQRRASLIAALRSMSPASLAYKRLDNTRDELIHWLGGHSPS